MPNLQVQLEQRLERLVKWFHGLLAPRVQLTGVAALQELLPLCFQGLTMRLATIWWRGTRAAPLLPRSVDGVASEMRPISRPTVARSIA